MIGYSMKYKYIYIVDEILNKNDIGIIRWMKKEGINKFEAGENKIHLSYVYRIR